MGGYRPEMGSHLIILDHWLALSILGKIGCDRRISFSFKDFKREWCWRHLDWFMDVLFPLGPTTAMVVIRIISAKQGRCQKIWQMLIVSDFANFWMVPGGSPVFQSGNPVFTISSPLLRREPLNFGSVPEIPGV